MKRITFGILAFFLTFGISVSLVGLLFGLPKVNRDHHHAGHSPGALRIENVLDQDIRYGETRRQAEVRLAQNLGGDHHRLEIPVGSLDHAKIIGQYSSNQAEIDVSGTPSDFRYAWNRHLEAWEKFTVYSKTLAKGNTSNSRSINYDPEEINETYYQVLRIAKRYGAHIKPRYLR